MAQQEGTVIEGEALESHASPQIASDKYEEKARKLHWAPLEEWRGDAEDWVPAKEFVQRQKLYDRIDSLKDAIKSQKQDAERDFAVVSKAVSEMNELAYKKALGELKAQRALAVEDRNVEAVEALDEEIQGTTERLKVAEKASKEIPKKQQVEESPEFKDWKESNKWFDDDTEMRDDAIAIGVGYAAKNPNKSEKDVYAYTTERIQRMYPEKFKKSAKSESQQEGEETGEQPRRKQVANVEGAGGPRQSGGTGKAGRKVTVADLDDQQRTVMKTLIKRNVFKEAAAKNKRTQEEEYLAQYQENADRQSR